MIDIEKIADSIRPKAITYNSTGSSLAAKGDFIFSEYPLRKEIFKARDIKNLNERKDYLLKIITEQKELATTPKYVKPLFKGFEINDKWVPLKEKEIKLEPDQELIQQCENELLIINDLLVIDKIIIEYSEIKGENEKRHYLIYAKDGQTNNAYQQPKYYTVYEFAQIIETIAAMLNKQVAESQGSTNQRLPWKGSLKDLSELIKALSLTALKGIPETEIIKVFESILEYKDKPVDLKRHEVNKNELQDTKPSEMFTSKMSKAIEEFLKKKYQ